MRLKHIITAWLLLALLIAAGSVFATEEIDDEATPEAQVESSEATAEATQAVTGQGEFAESGGETDAAEEDEADEAPAGIGLLFLLLGAGAIVAVGGTMIARENFRDRD
jgi:hypothetical protein